MKLPDVNLLLYAIDEDSPRFEQAAPWNEALFGGTETVALAWAVALAFVRLTTKPRVMAQPFSVPLGAGGNLATDAHLAALSIEHGAELCSSDADVSRFPGVRWYDPLREG